MSVKKFNFSDKRSYLIQFEGCKHKEIVHVVKTKYTPDKSDQEVTFVLFDRGLPSPVTLLASTMDIISVNPVLTSTEFFTMHWTYEGWKKRDKEFADKLAISICSTILERGIENIGSGKFEEYDVMRLQRFLLDMQDIDDGKADEVFSFLLITNKEFKND